MKDIRVESYQYIHVLYATLRYLVSFASSFLSRNNHRLAHPPEAVKS